MNRHCGDCTLCCKLLPVRELAKPADTRCQHQGLKGCTVYRRAGFPPSCALWSCRWLVGDGTADMPRPDRVGYVIDLVPDIVRARNNETGEVQEIEVVQVWAEPGRDPTHDKRLRRYAERQAERGAALIIRYGTGRAVAVFAPALSHDGKWHIVSDERIVRVETQTGNLLLDQLKGVA